MKLPSTFPVTCHTRYIGQGSTFVAILGGQHNGVDYIPLALEKGATRIVVADSATVSDEIKQSIKDAHAELLYVDDARKALAQLSAQAAGNPAKQLKIIGITGTKGKTTTAFLLSHILRDAGIKTALLSTVENRINTHAFSPLLTTEQPDYIHQFLRVALDAGITHVVMEVAAQAISLYRVYGIQFDAVVFTNFSHEHLEFYESLDAYFAAKCALFAQRKPDAYTLINQDDTWLANIIPSLDNVTTFGIEEQADVQGTVMGDPLTSLTCMMNISGHNYRFECPVLFGAFNAYNIMAAVAVALQCDVSSDDVAAALYSFDGVPGRCERYDLQNGSIGIVDYAHNPASYKLLLSTLRQLTGHLIVVFGAGGSRDHDKRSIMGSIATDLADEVILTSDNPRDENPQDIIDMIRSGVAESNQHKVTEEIDREEAIKKAYACSRQSSIIAVLGKGPDEYQIIGDIKYPFSDAALLCAFMD